MQPPAYIIGIDLGTTHCALAYVGIGSGSINEVQHLPIPQLVRPGQVDSRELLPSALYLPLPDELSPGSTTLPWGGSSESVVGEFARWQGAQVPGRLVASAKSWLCHPGVDRLAAILPWGAPATHPRISPVDASSRLLRHLAAAWNHTHPEAALGEQEVVLTVPASFDEAARALTVSAAQQAGLNRLQLVEEPQAAFHAFAHAHRARLTQALQGVRLVLVIDVGGGTTDFTLIRVEGTGEEPALERIAVGEHLMLGGDNMDAAIARRLEERLASGGRRLNASQWHQLVQAARMAKERLLGEDAPPNQQVSIAGSGSSLLGSTLRAEVDREEVERLLLDGFFPAMDPAAAAAVRPSTPRVALQEPGLPYAKDPAITRHLAAFLRAHAGAANAALGGSGGALGLPRPDAVLLNGGVFRSHQISRHLMSVLSAWWPGSAAIPLLEHRSLDLAVAYGAVAHGMAQRGMGRRISGGSAHAVYVGLAPAHPDGRAQALCVLARGQVPGVPTEITSRSFMLTLGRPVQFPLYSTAADREDQAGDVVPVDESMNPLPPSHALLRSATGRAGVVPVHLRSLLTELGTLELWCVSPHAADPWKLEFDLRGTNGPGAGDPTAMAGNTPDTLPRGFAEARAAIELAFGPSAPADAKSPRQLARSLESVLGPREGWSLQTLRELWAILFANAGRRRRSPDHERSFYQLLGFTLRPGFGYPLDAWRCEQCFGLFAEGVKFHGEIPVWNEFWVFWRRIAGGLGEERQRAIWAFLRPVLSQRIPPSSSSSRPQARPKGIRPEGLDEMCRTAAALEHVPASEKAELGDWILGRLSDPATARGPWAWALGRLGARWPVHGSGHNVIDPGKIAQWLQLLLQPAMGTVDGVPFAISTLARLTGDRTRDLDDETRAAAARFLRDRGTPDGWVRVVQEVVALEAADVARAIGDSLPIGLRLK